MNGCYMATILLIDDNEELAECLQLVLQAEGFDAVTACNGLDGIRIARKQHPDLVLCDIDMPGISGYEVLEAIQYDPMISDIPLVFLTGREQLSDFRQGVASGAQKYLRKPITARDLLAVISACLQSGTGKRRAKEGRCAWDAKKPVCVCPVEYRHPSGPAFYQ
jgi:CheY-like chemotaxis protein